MICGHRFGAVERSKITSPSEKKTAESIEDTYKPQHVVKFTPRDDKHVVRKIGSTEQGEVICPPSAGVVL